MADWEQLRDLAREVVPPEFATLERTAHRRQRLAGAVVAAVAALALVGGGIGILSTGDRDGTVEPAKDPTGTHTGLTAPVRALPDAAPGESAVDVAAGRYRVPIDGHLSFDIDLPDRTTAHDGGLFLATQDFIVKTELAGRRYGVPRDPCHDPAIRAVGPAVDDLVRALVDLPVYEVSRPAHVRLGGADAIYLEARVPDTYDDSRCEGGAVQLPGNPGTAVSGPAPYLGRWWVLDVDGRRVVVQQNCWGCPAGRFDEAPQTPQSITFTPTD
ncbi:hypothetical protein CFH99_17445 [Nocardioides aromaticivorans]|uniref:Uncharacterized protein n=1 Tax=Nocardioides aromaticivorans TaxID=200618 RepID=A0ABX7PN59_9ACTN|nr:hypothetical protein [Nocardioides aromaticivorans]QSR27408.1 hypothetical protein CFH99_17445 [Nocardioides aromaticivorans]